MAPSNQPKPPAADVAAWSERLLHLADRLRAAALAGKAANPNQVHPMAQGAGDVSFAPDVVTEEVLSAWLAEQARQGPLSLLTEETGWRHGGPSASDPGWQALPDFGHGGPRVVVDPIDGTRPWLHGLRSAWSVLAWAPPGDRQPTLGEVQWGCVAEIPLPEAGWVRRLSAQRGRGCWRRDVPLVGQAPQPSRRCRTPDPSEVQPGFYPFFAFHPAQRPTMAKAALEFLERLQHWEGLALDQAYEDPYIASGGQFALLAMGHYPMLVDARPKVLGPGDLPTQCAKAYDIAGAVLCAQEAGAVVLDLEGHPLDGPLDVSTPFGWVAYGGPRSQKRLHPHYLAGPSQFFSR